VELQLTFGRHGTHERERGRLNVRETMAFFGLCRLLIKLA
jgi:hypothetical protein